MDYIKNTIAENFGGAAQHIVSEDKQFSLTEVPDLTDKVAIVTGGSEGIGYGCTHTLLSKNIKKLFILSLHQDIVDGALDSLRSEMGEAAASKVVWLKCDLSDWKAVTLAADKIAQQTDRIDILVCNAARGIMTYQLSVYGVDLHMALNHMGHTVLVSHLLPILKKTADAGSKVRVVSLGSNAHQSAPSDTKFASLNELNTDLGPNGQYGRSKLAVMLYMRWMARHVTPEHPNLLFNSVHPGFVSTRQSKELIHEAYPLGGYAMSVGMEPFKKDQFEGCVSAMYAATVTDGSGQYICPPKIVEKGSALYNDDALMDQLMKLTTEIVKDKTFDQSEQKGCPFTKD